MKTSILTRACSFSQLQSPGGREFWDEHGKFGVHEDFRKNVERILAEDDKPYSMDFQGGEDEQA